MINGSIREALEEIYDQQTKGSDSTPEPREEQETTDTDGAANEIESVAQKDEKQHAEENQAELDEEEEDFSGDEAEKSKKQDKAPSYVSKEYLNSYHEWNEEAKNYIAKREKDIAAGFAKQDEMREFGRKASAVFKKYEDHLSSLGVKDPTEIIDPLLSYEKVLRTGSQTQKVNAIKNLLQEYQIDVNYLTTDHQPNNQNPGYDNSELHNLRRDLELFKQEQQRRELEPFERLVQDFVGENPFLNDPKIQNTVQHLLNVNADEYRNKDPREVLADATNKAMAAFGITKPISQNKSLPALKQNVQKAKEMAISPKADAGNSSQHEPQFKSMREALEYEVNKRSKG